MAAFVGRHPVAQQVLVADDEPHIRRVLRTLLENAGMEVDAARDGTEALAKLADQTLHFDLVLLDIMMPGHTGLEVLEHASALPHRAGLRVIVLTAKGQDADRERAFALGAADFITKPFSPKKLLVRIRELLGS